MKKSLIIFAAIAIVVTLVSCTSSTTQENENHINETIALETTHTPATEESTQNLTVMIPQTVIQVEESQDSTQNKSDYSVQSNQENEPIEQKPTAANNNYAVIIQ